MNAADADRALFTDTLVSDDEFPASVRLARSTRESSDAVRRAEITLRAMSAIEDAHDESENSAAGEKLNARIEAKLDLTLGLLGMIAAQNAMIPSPQAVRWSSNGLRLHAADALPVGSSVICSSYLLTTLPLPVDMPLDVIACERAADGYQVWLKLPENADAVRDGIERELFRRHRRQIAERRAAKS